MRVPTFASKLYAYRYAAGGSHNNGGKPGGSSPPSLQIVEDKRRGVWMRGATEVNVRDGVAGGGASFLIYFLTFCP